MYIYGIISLLHRILRTKDTHTKLYDIVLYRNRTETTTAKRNHMDKHHKFKHRECRNKF